MLISAKDQLQKFGISMEDALTFIVTNIAQHQVIFQALKSVGVTTRMVTEILQQAAPEKASKVVQDYFIGAGLDYVELDLPDIAAIKAFGTFTQLADGNEKFSGTDGSDYVRGGAGGDEVDGLGGADFLLGEGGNDILYGRAGNNYLEGGDGDDQVFIHSDDYASEFYYSNIIFGNSGDDFLNGGDGSDHIYGGEGADDLSGDAGVYLFNTGSNDWLDGGSGDDVLSVSGGFDIVLGGEGNDSIHSFAVYGSARIDAGAGNDLISFCQGDQVNAGSGDDILIYSWESSSRIADSSVDAGHSLIVVGEGADSIRFDRLEAGSNITLDLGEVVSSVDTVGPIYLESQFASPVLVIQGFTVGTDKIDINDVRIYGKSSSIEAVSPSPGSANYAQILTSADEAYRLPLSSGQKTADDYGKAFFVVQGASAAASDAASAAQLLDVYGRNATYDKSGSHYFLVNVGEEDCVLYFFTDEGANNQMIADELTPVLLLSGVRTEDFSAADLAYTFI